MKALSQVVDGEDDQIIDLGHAAAAPTVHLSGDIRDLIAGDVHDNQLQDVEIQNDHRFIGSNGQRNAGARTG
jgi:hypothetical protein